MSDRMETATAGLVQAREDKAAEVAALAERLDTARAELRRIDQALKALDPAVGKRSEPDFAVRVEELLREHGPMTQAEVSHVIQGPRSRAMHALRVLEKRGAASRTGAVRSRSPEFAVAADG